MDWSPTECKACFKWCLRGKASKFCNALLKTHKDISFKRLLKKLADRFGDDDFRAAAVSKFNQAHQKKDETLDDWADRVRDLAAKAFRAVSEVYCQEQAVQKFCENMLDNEAGHNILLQGSTTLEQAMKPVRLFQHTKNACYKQKLDKGRSCRITAENYEDVTEICTVKGQPDMSAILKEMAEQRQILDKLVLRDANKPTFQRRGQRGTNAQGERLYYFCHEPGHFKRDCKKAQERQGLNQPGASQRAEARTQQSEGPALIRQ